MNRRGFLSSILAAMSAPAIVKAHNIMRVFAPAESGLLLPEADIVVPTLVSVNQLLTIDQITTEAMKHLNAVINGLRANRLIETEFRL